jgi:hypothetical protein
MQLSQAVREYMAKNHGEFRVLYEQHQKHEKELEDMAKKGFLSQEEELRVATMKKKKLALKDQMYIIAKQHEGEIRSMKS